MIPQITDLDSDKQLHIIKGTPSLIVQVSPEDQTEEMCLIAVQTDWYLLGHVHNQTEAICLAAIKHNPLAYMHVTIPITESMQLQAVSNVKHLSSVYEHPLQYIQDPSTRVLRRAVKMSSYAIKNIQNPSSDLVALALERHPETIAYIDQTPEICWDAIKRKPLVIKYVKNPSEDMCFYAVEQQPCLLKYVPKHMRTPDLCKLAISINALDVIQHIPCMTEELAELALPTSVVAFKYLSHREDLYEMAVRLYPTIIKHIQKQTEDLCWLALEKDPSAFIWIKNPTPEMCEYVLSREGNHIASIREPTEDMCFRAIEAKPISIKFIKNPTYEMKRLAIKLNPLALAFIKEQDYDMVLEAVTSNGCAFKYANIQDEEICSIAVRNFALALCWIESPTLDMCIEACQQMPQALLYVPQKWQSKCAQFVEKDHAILDKMLYGRSASLDEVKADPWNVLFCKNPRVNDSKLFKRDPRIVLFIQPELSMSVNAINHLAKTHPQTEPYLAAESDYMDLRYYLDC